MLLRKHAYLHTPIIFEDQSTPDNETLTRKRLLNNEIVFALRVIENVLTLYPSLMASFTVLENLLHSHTIKL